MYRVITEKAFEEYMELRAVGGDNYAASQLIPLSEVRPRTVLDAEQRLMQLDKMLREMRGISG